MAIGQGRVPSLFEPEHCGASNEGKAGFSDPAFAGNKTAPVHRWVPWIAGYSCDFVRQALDRYLDSEGTVLDPFCGVGTTLVEAALRGHNATGFEINPYAALASRVKANWASIDEGALMEEIAEFARFYSERSSDPSHRPESTIPDGFRTRSEFYSPSVLRKVLIVRDYIKRIEDDRLRGVFRLAFGSTMVSYSNYSYEPSLGARASCGKPNIADYPVGEAITAKLREVIGDVRWMGRRVSRHPPAVRVFEASFFGYRNFIPPASADLLVTSPPYLNNYHYVRNTRPQLFWLDFVATPRDLRKLEVGNFGKFWQTVRDKAHVGMEFELPGSDLDEVLAEIRQINGHRGVYGGNGWANYAASYFNDCYRFAQGIRYSLRAGGTALVVLGNSIIQGVTVPTDVYFGQIAEAAGLTLVSIHVPRPSRVGSSIVNSGARLGAGDKRRLYEAVVEIRNDRGA